MDDFPTFLGFNGNEKKEGTGEEGGGEKVCQKASLKLYDFILSIITAHLPFIHGRPW